jgi:hypothetical protein
MDTSFTEFKFDSGNQYGLIAQDVHDIFPDLVAENTSFGLYDSIGNQTVAPTTYLGVKYMEFIPILIKGMQQQQELIVNQSLQMQEMQNQIQAIQDSIFSMQNRQKSLLKKVIQ